MTATDPASEVEMTLHFAWRVVHSTLRETGSARRWKTLGIRAIHQLDNDGEVSSKTKTEVSFINRHRFEPVLVVVNISFVFRNKPY